MHYPGLCRDRMDQRAQSPAGRQINAVMEGSKMNCALTHVKHAWNLLHASCVWKTQECMEHLKYSLGLWRLASRVTGAHRNM